MALATRSGFARSTRRPGTRQPPGHRSSPRPDTILGGGSTESAARGGMSGSILGFVARPLATIPGRRQCAQWWQATPPDFTAYSGPFRIQLFATHRHRDVNFRGRQRCPRQSKAEPYRDRRANGAFAEPGRFINPNGLPRLEAVASQAGGSFPQPGGGEQAAEIRPRVPGSCRRGSPSCTGTFR